METPSNLKDNTINELKSLITANANSAEIYRNAAELSPSSGLTSLFTDIAVQRDRYASDLQQALELTGETKSYETNLVEPLQSWWMKARDMVQKDEQVGLLSELERSEDRILAAYKDALTETAGSPLNARLTEQVTGVKAHHDQIRDMRDAAKARA